MAFKIMNREAERFLAHPGLVKFMDREDGIPFKIRYRVTKIKNKLETEIKAFIDSRTVLLKKYSVKINGEPKMSENGGYVIDPKFLDKLNEELLPVAEEFIKLGKGFEFLKVDIENDEAYQVLSGNEIEMLLLLIDKPEKEVK